MSIKETNPAPTDLVLAAYGILRAGYREVDAAMALERRLSGSPKGGEVADNATRQAFELFSTFLRKTRGGGHVPGIEEAATVLLSDGEPDPFAEFFAEAGGIASALVATGAVPAQGNVTACGVTARAPAEGDPAPKRRGRPRKVVAPAEPTTEATPAPEPEAAQPEPAAEASEPEPTAGDDDPFGAAPAADDPFSVGGDAFYVPG